MWTPPSFRRESRTAPGNRRAVQQRDPIKYIQFAHFQTISAVSALVPSLYLCKIVNLACRSFVSTRLHSAMTAGFSDWLLKHKLMAFSVLQRRSRPGRPSVQFNSSSIKTGASERKGLCSACRKTYYQTNFAKMHYSSSARLVIPCRWTINGPFTLTIFAAISAAISSAILRRINYWRFRGEFQSPVVYTGDLKSPRNGSKERL